MNALPPMANPNAPQLLQHFFAHAVAHFPHHIAVRLADPTDALEIELSYAEVWSRAHQFADVLRERGIGVGDRVALCLPRGLDIYWTILGILEVGAVYVPLDPGYPDDRITFIVNDSAARLVITSDERARSLLQLGINCFTYTRAFGHIARHSRQTAVVDAATADDLAYIIYTSGSTGRPKGVMIRHSNACAWLEAENKILNLTAGDIVYQGFSLAFDMSIEEMWTTFAAGAMLLVGNEAMARAGPDLIPVLANAGVTVWHTVPSLAAVVAPDIPSLRLLNLGGEACPPEVVRLWARPDLRILNTYGPTETTVTATWTELVPGEAVTIGKALPGYRTWVVDQALQPLAAMQEGELVIGGPAVGAGYVNLPALSADKFITASFTEDTTVYRTGDLVRENPDGNLEFLGRIDAQVKIRGFRVELGEIETVLADSSDVAQTVVALQKDPAGFDALVAYLQPVAGHQVDLATAKARATKRLPNYMRPSAYMIIDTVPRLVSGKIDRKALPAISAWERVERQIVPPTTPLQAKLVAIWQKIFAPQQVSVDDDFFEDLDGHSLKAARAVSDARADPELAHLSIKDIYDHKNIAAIAEALDDPATKLEQTKDFFRVVQHAHYRLCVLAQALCLPLIFGFAGLPWLTPYLLYSYLGSVGWTRLHALVAAAIAFVTVPALLILVAIALKWLIIGRYRPGHYPLWGLYYFRWWLARRILTVVPTRFLAGTPMMAFYFRALGARIGRNVFVGLNDMDAADLVTIGDRSILSDGAMLAHVAIEKGELRIGHISLEPDCFLGVQAVVGRDCHLESAARLEDLSMLPSGSRIPSGETWAGSPARLSARAQPVAAAPLISMNKYRLVTLCLLLASPLLPLASVLPIAPGLILMIELDWTSEGYSFLLLSPLLGATYVLLMCLQTAAMKWLLLGRVKPGRYLINSFFYVRFWFMRQLGELALELILPIYATLYLRPWYRLMGVKIGARAEISTATAIIPDLVDIGAESFVADGVVFGAPRIEPGMLRLERTSIGRRSFVGNSALLPTGAHLSDDVLVGVLSQPPASGAAGRDSGTSWFGSPAILLPRRQRLAQFDEGSTFTPPRKLVLLRYAIEYFRVTLPMTIFVALFSLMLSFVGDITDLRDAETILLSTYPILYMLFCMSGGLVVILLKWLVIGRYKPTTKPLWSLFVWRSELITSLYENLVAPALLQPLLGTPFINIYLRLLGAKIGRRVFTDTTDITEFDLIDIGDDAALNEQAGLQTHLFEDRIMKLGKVTIGQRASVGSMAIVLYDAILQDDSSLGDLSVAMKGETLTQGTAWEGSPARLAG